MNDIIDLILGLGTIFATVVVGMIFLNAMNIFAKRIDGENDVD